jgi:DNA-binding beta-propeller fold protein YncE
MTIGVVDQDGATVSLVEPAALKRPRRGDSALDAEEKQFHELAVFAGRGPVPLSAVEALWAAHGMSPAATAQLVTEFRDRSLVQLSEGGRLIVDERTDGAAAGSAVSRRGLATAHGRLLDGYRSRCADGSWSSGPNDGYFFENVAYHMAQANRARELHCLLLDYDWLRQKLAVAGIIGLLADFAHHPQPADVKIVDEALASSAVDLAIRPEHLATHLAGRLVGLPSPEVRRLLAQMRDRAPRPWIWPVMRTVASTAESAQLESAGHVGVLRALAITPDGHRLMSGGDDHTIRVWDIASGELQRTLRGHADSVRAVAVTPDGNRIISGGTYDVVRVWDLKTGQFLQTISGDSGYRAVHTVAVTPNGKSVLWAGAGAKVQVWDLASGRLEHVLKSCDHDVRYIVVTPDGRLALTGGDVGIVQIWDLASGRLIRLLNGKSHPVFSVAVTPDGGRVVSGGYDSSVCIWELESGRLERTLWGHTGVVDTVVVTGDGFRIVSSGQDRKMLVWDLRTGAKVATWDSGPDTQVTAVCPVPTDPSRIACGHSGGDLEVLQLLEA